MHKQPLAADCSATRLPSLAPSGPVLPGVFLRRRLLPVLRGGLGQAGRPLCSLLTSDEVARH